MREILSGSDHSLQPAAHTWTEQGARVEKYTHRHLIDQAGMLRNYYLSIEKDTFQLLFQILLRTGVICAALSQPAAEGNQARLHYGDLNAADLTLLGFFPCLVAAKFGKLKNF